MTRAMIARDRGVVRVAGDENMTSPNEAGATGFGPKVRLLESAGGGVAVAAHSASGESGTKTRAVSSRTEKLVAGSGKN